MAGTEIVEITIDDDDDESFDVSFANQDGINGLNKSNLGEKQIRPLGVSSSPPTLSNYLASNSQFSVGISKNEELVELNPISNENNLSDHEFEVTDGNFITLLNKAGHSLTHNSIPSTPSPYGISRMTSESSLTDAFQLESSITRSPSLVPSMDKQAKSRHPKNKKPYWAGSEHTKPVTKEQPIILLDKLPLDVLKAKYLNITEDNGHSCSGNCKSNRVRRPKPKPRSKLITTGAIGSYTNPSPLYNAASEEESVNLLKIIDTVAKNGPPRSSSLTKPAPFPCLDDWVSFRLRTCSLSHQSNIDNTALSPIKRGKIVNIHQEYNLYEVQLAQPELLSRKLSF